MPCSASAGKQSVGRSLLTSRQTKKLSSGIGLRSHTARSGTTQALVHSSSLDPDTMKGWRLPPSRKGLARSAIAPTPIVPIPAGERRVSPTLRIKSACQTRRSSGQAGFGLKSCKADICQVLAEVDTQKAGSERLKLVDTCRESGPSGPGDQNWILSVR
jgi:hypothetical protein